MTHNHIAHHEGRAITCTGDETLPVGPRNFHFCHLVATDYEYASRFGTGPEAAALVATRAQTRAKAGPGTELKKLLASIGVADLGTCDCNARAAQMDTWGPAECRARRAEIIGWLTEGAGRWGWLAKLAAKAMPLGWLVDEAISRADTGGSILLTGGIGDAIALEGLMRPEEREQLATITYACPAAALISDLFAALPNFPRLGRHTILPTGRGVFYSQAAVEAVTAPLPGVDDWSIATIFPQGRAYVGSSLLAHRLAEPRPVGRPYAVINPTSQSFGRWNGRDFDGDDWRECLAWLERRDLVGVVMSGDRTDVPPSPRLIDWQQQTRLAESVELLKRAVGFLGIDSWMSVLAAKLFPSTALSIKSVWGHCYDWKHVYYAPRSDFGFLQRRIVAP